MENKKAFRLQLNLFDGLVILAAIVVGAVLLWMQLKPSTSGGASTAQTIRYTIRMIQTVPGTGELIQSGDTLIDVVKNYELGEIISADAVPAYDFAVDSLNHAYVNVEIPGKEDIYILMESDAVITDEAIIVDGGYEVRVGETVYLRGPGYLGSGKIYAIERGE